MFCKFRHITFTTFSRLICLLVCLNVSVISYGSVRQCELMSSDCVQQKENIPVNLIDLLTNIPGDENDEESSQKVDDLQTNISDYIVDNRSNLIDHSLILFAWLDNHLPMCLQMPCLDQPLTPPEHC